MGGAFAPPILISVCLSDRVDKLFITIDNQIMIGFLIKKNFFDLWDNLFRIALLNLGFIASLAIPIFIPQLLAGVPVLGLIMLFAGIIWCFIYLSAAALCVKSVSDYGGFGFADFFSNLKAGWPLGIVAGLMVFIFYLMVSVVMNFYLSLDSVTGLMLAAIIFWTIIIGVISFQFIFAVRARLDTKISKILKKCLIVFFDNPGFCIFTFFHNTVMLIISIFLALLFPGPAGILLFLDEGLRLRLLKYDWLEANPEADRKKIPWDAILIDEREKTGTRSLRNFIFPWKD